MAREPRVLIVGLGSIGRRHLANLRALGAQVAVLRRSPETAREAEAELGVTAFGAREAAEAWEPEAVVVATVTSEHVPVARWAAGIGAHVFVEKPLSHTLEGVDELLREAEDAGRCLAVGYNLRFHPGLEVVKDAVDGGRIGRLLSARIEVGQYLPAWHPGEDYRTGYVAQRSLGGGALLSLVHELDLAIWIAGDVVDTVGISAHLSELEIQTDDVAELVCVHRAGSVSSVHMDLVDRSFNRRSRWVGEEGTVSFSWGGPTLLETDAGAEVLWEDPAYDLNESYRAELEDFLVCVESGASPRAGGAEARHALEIAATVREVGR